MSFWNNGTSVPVITDFVPSVSGAYSLGSTTFRWASLYLSDDIDAQGDATIGGNLTVNGNTVLGNASTDTLQLNSAAIDNPNGSSFSNALQIKASVGVPADVTDGPWYNYVAGTFTARVIFGSGANYSWKIATRAGSVTTDIVEVHGGTGRVYVNGSFGRNIPVTKNASFTLGDTENYVVCNGAAVMTVTLPAASSYPGREVFVKNIAAFALFSASANVRPIADSAAGTAILPATDGAWAMLVSDGTAWTIMMRGT